ncbi:hypothetical protein PRIPAC_90997, partial [Pristionchus pacificus]
TLFFLTLSQTTDPMDNFHIPVEYQTYFPYKKGAGRLGYIMTLKNPENDSSIVIKKYSEPFSSEKRARVILRELNLLRTTRHANIVQLLGFYRMLDFNGKYESYYNVTEYCGKSLKVKIEEGLYGIFEMKKWTIELLRAVQYLHSIQVIHGNLNTQKMCIDSCNKLTLTDFGKGDLQEEPLEEYDHQYMPIEQLVGWNDPITESADMWSIAVILCEMFTGYPVFYIGTVKDTLKQQISYCGPVDEEVLNKVTSQDDKNFLIEYSRLYASIFAKDAKNKRMTVFSRLYRHKLARPKLSERDIEVNIDIIEDFAEQTLQLDPTRRMSTMRALSHSFLQIDRYCEIRSMRPLSHSFLQIDRSCEQEAINDEGVVSDELKERVLEEFLKGPIVANRKLEKKSEKDATKNAEQILNLSEEKPSKDSGISANDIVTRLNAISIDTPSRAQGIINEDEEVHYDKSHSFISYEGDKICTEALEDSEIDILDLLDRGNGLIYVDDLNILHLEMKDMQFSYNNNKREVLGEGRFTTIFKGTLSIYYVKKSIAIKTMNIILRPNKHEIKEKNFRRIFKRRPNNKNVVKLFGFFREKLCLHMCMELMDANLAEVKTLIYMEEGSRMTKAQIESFLGCVTVSVVDALSFFRREECTLYDITPFNIMINNRGNVKLHDFDFAKSIQAVTQTSFDISKGGLLRYMAPELLSSEALWSNLDDEYKIMKGKSEVWSLGII